MQQRNLNSKTKWNGCNIKFKGYLKSWKLDNFARYLKNNLKNGSVPRYRSSEFIRYYF